MIDTASLRAEMTRYGFTPKANGGIYWNIATYFF